MVYTLHCCHSFILPCSVDEHALIDLPTMINYVLKTTGEKQLIYVGYSQGTQMAFAGFTANKTLARSIKLFFGLAPVATLRHVRGAFNWMASMYPVIRVSYNERIESHGVLFLCSSEHNNQCLLRCKLKNSTFLVCMFARCRRA